MNNTKTKQIIAGLPDESWVTFYNTDRDTHIDAAELKALAAAVPEWVPINSETDLPPEKTRCVWRDRNGNYDVFRCLTGGTKANRKWMADTYAAYLVVPRYQEDKDE